MGLPMDIILHAHKAAITAAQQQRAELGLRKLERRLGRATAAVVRFAGDGPLRRVEIAVDAPRAKRYVAEGTGRSFGTAITAALARLNAQLDHLKRAKKPRPRRKAAA